MRPMQPQKFPTKWYYSIPAVLIALFLLLGPFAFPLLWKSPRFNLTWKILLTAAVAAMTYYIIAGFWHLIRVTVDALSGGALM